jgi:transcriptional regulator with XRE-family HTH domain
MNIGKLIKNTREKIGMSQLALCKQIGIKQPSLSNIERGINYPSFKTLEKIKKVLKIYK